MKAWAILSANNRRPRDRHHVVPPKISSFSFYSTLLVSFPRSAELRLEAPMRSEGDKSRRLFSLVSAQYLLYCTLEIVIPTKSEYPPEIGKGSLVRLQKCFLACVQKRAT